MSWEFAQQKVKHAELRKQLLTDGVNMAKFKGIKIYARKVPGIGYQYRIDGQLWSQNTFRTESDAVLAAKEVMRKAGI